MVEYKRNCPSGTCLVKPPQECICLVEIPSAQAESYFLTGKMRFVIREAIKKRIADTIGHEPSASWVDNVTRNTIAKIEKTKGRQGMTLETSLVAIKIALESNTPDQSPHRSESGD